MGEVAISLKITPEDPKKDLQEILGEIEKEFTVEDSETESIGFGLSALKVLIVRGEDEGGTDDIENFIENIDGVTSVRVENVSLL